MVGFHMESGSTGATPANKFKVENSSPRILGFPAACAFSVAAEPGGIHPPFSDSFTNLLK